MLIAPLLRSESFPVRLMTSREGFPQGIAPHCHNGFELRVVLGGEPERIERLDLIHPDVCHCNMEPEEWHRSWILLLRRDELSISQGVTLPSTLQSPDLPGFLELLKTIEDTPADDRLLDFRLQLALLLLHGEVVGEGREEGRMVWMAEYLRSHYYDRNLSIAELSRQAGCSPNYVQQLFRRETGMTPMAYLRKVRMEAAARFLGERRYLVKEIALLCGFSNAHFFAAAFRGYYGCPPTEYAAGIPGREVRRLSRHG